MPLLSISTPKLVSELQYVASNLYFCVYKPSLLYEFASLFILNTQTNIEASIYLS